MSQLSITLFGVHGEALALRQERLALIASNIANADTPGYRAQDMDFSKALNSALAQSPDAVQSAEVQGHLPLPTDSSAVQGRYLRSALQPSRDDNTVDAEQEKAMFAKAALEYRASLTFFEGRVRTLMTAITGE